ncbi:MAG TPA: 4a-hydroxytetrahydrobiopterin dehydratase [Mycobacteriales bacterium]|jgi:4a-hydroxytetrahydrobiopterin dehydratase|nr:4a-hydroxytetrahydrobiopterin dehydratase [Mycobacteriales bacterium]
MPSLLSADQLATRLADRPDWNGDTRRITRTVSCPSFRAAIGLVAQVADVAEELDHHPDIDIRWRDVTFGCSTHSAGGVTELDLALAARIDALATGS